MYKLLCLISFLLLCHFVPAQKNEQYVKLNALAGRWQMETPRGSLFEEWQVVGKNTMHGRSYKLTNTDTMVLEAITLTQKPEGIFYIPLVTNQNNQKPVSFKMISGEDGIFTFENKSHDFPQRIIYRIVHVDSVVARIEGTKNGKQRSSEYTYRRIN